MNLGFKVAQGKYVCMVSDDCLVLPDAIRNGYRRFEEQSSTKKVGAMAFYFRDWPESTHYHVNINYGHPYVNHGLYLGSALREVGYLDEDHFGFYCGDIDVVMKLREAGYVCLDAPESFIEHFSHANRAVRGENARCLALDGNALRKKWSRYGDPGGEWREMPFHNWDDHVAQIYWPLLIREAVRQRCFSPVATFRLLARWAQHRRHLRGLRSEPAASVDRSLPAGADLSGSEEPEESSRGERR
jgi:hypothetical protein